MIWYLCILLQNQKNFKYYLIIITFCQVFCLFQAASQSLSYLHLLISFQVVIFYLWTYLLQATQFANAALVFFWPVILQSKSLERNFYFFVKLVWPTWKYFRLELSRFIATYWSYWHRLECNCSLIISLRNQEVPVYSFLLKSAFWAFSGSYLIFQHRTWRSLIYQLYNTN